MTKCMIFFPWEKHMKKVLIAFTIILTFMVFSCAMDIPEENLPETADLTINLEISEEIKDDVQVNVALFINDAFTTNIALSNEENSKTEKVAVTTYNVRVQDNEHFDFDYPDSIKIVAGGKNTLTIKVTQKSEASEGEEDPVDPPLVTYTGISIDFCNVFDKTLHYEIYDSRHASDPIKSGDIKKDEFIDLKPGTYYISSNLVEPIDNIEFWAISETSDQIDPSNKIGINVTEGKRAFIGYIIKDKNIGTRNSRIVINPTVGKEYLGENAFGHNVLIDYTINYGTGLTQKKTGTTTTDHVIDLGYEFIPAKCEFTVCEMVGDDKVASENYVLWCKEVYSGSDDLQGMTYTKNICIYRAATVEFKVDTELAKNQSLEFYTNQNYNRIYKYSTDGKITLAYDLPYDIDVYVVTTDEGGNKSFTTYCNYDGLVFSQGDSKVIHLASNVE